MTPKQVAAELGCNVAAVYRSVERNGIPYVRLHPRGAIHIPRSALQPRER